MVSQKNPKIDLKLHHRQTLEWALILSLSLHLFLFRALPDLRVGNKVARAKAIQIQVEEIPPTEQLRKLEPPPPRPSVPVPSEDEDVPDDLTIETTDLSLDLSELPPPPPLREDNINEHYVFVPYDEAPTPIGGMAAIRAHLKYPEIAKKAGLEAKVVVGALIGVDGRTLNTRILKGSGMSVGFEKAAQAAVMQVRWKPAKQRERPVKVWISIPIHFQLATPQKNAT